MATIFAEKKQKSRESIESESTVADTATREDLEESSGPLPLEELLSKGFTHKDLESLRESGFHTVECVAFAPDRAIMAVKNFSDVKCAKLKQACGTLIGLSFCSAADFLNARENMIKFTTGCSALDRLLCGGVETGNITELVGEYRSGKTQLCHVLAVTCQLPVDNAGADGRCLWIDTEGTFRPERIVSIATRFHLTTQKVLDNILYARAYHTDHLLNLLLEAAAIMSHSRFALVVVDSIIALHRSEFNGRGDLAPRQMHLGRCLRVLQKIADTFGVAVVITNQVMAKVDGMPGADKIPAGGHVLAHASQTRMMIRKGKGEARICKVIDSPSLPESEAQYKIDEGGILDIT